MNTQDGRQIIGTVTLTEDTTVRNSYSYAAWHQDVRVKAGFTSQIAASRLGGDPFYWVIVPQGEGEVVSSNFTSGFGGMSYGSKIDEDKGTVAKAQPMQLYGYTVARILAENGGKLGPWQIALDPAYEVYAKDWKYTDGSTAYGLRAKAPVEA